MLLLSLLLATGVEWRPWSAETLDRARREEKPVFLAVTGKESPVALADDGVAETLGARFVAARVDRDERPDLADIARLSLAASSEADPQTPTASLWVVLTPALHPIEGGTLDVQLGAALAFRLSSVAADYGERRGEVEARAGVAATRLAAAQTPEPAPGPLVRGAIEHALKGTRHTGAPTPGALRLLLAESSRSPTPANREALSEALAALLASPVGPTVADEAMRLHLLADGFAATAESPLREGAVVAATRLLQGPRDPDGLFVAAAGDDRAFAFENGLAIGALAASFSALGRSDDRAAAIRTAAAIARFGPWPALARCTSLDGRCGRAFLEDYAFLAEGLLDLRDTTGDVRWGSEAQRAVDAAIGRFLDSASGGFFGTDVAHAPLPARLKSGYDDARPSANGVMASLLVRLARATGERRYAELARGVVDAFRGDLQRAPRGMETMAAATLPFVPPVAGAPAEPVHPARETRGAVTVEAALEPARVGAGGVFRAVVTLAIPPPWTVNGHRPPAGHLVPLTVSVPDDRFVVGLVQYPECSTCSRSARVTVTLRAGTKVPAGPTALRLTARFQRCRGSACEAPESVLLEAPLVVEAPGR